MYGTSREGKKRAEVPRRSGRGHRCADRVRPGFAEGHGYTQNPPRRSSNCARGVVRNCGPIQYEPQSVEGPRGFPSGGPADGKLCAAGLSQSPSSTICAGERGRQRALTSDANFTFTWTLTAAHATTVVPILRHQHRRMESQRATHPGTTRNDTLPRGALQRRAAAHGDFAFGRTAVGQIRPAPDRRRLGHRRHVQRLLLLRGRDVLLTPRLCQVFKGPLPDRGWLSTPTRLRIATRTRPHPRRY
jgi:hypothetical protein